jgi:hypothetical protein
MNQVIRHSRNDILNFLSSDFMGPIIKVERRNELLDSFIRKETLVIRVIFDSLGHLSPVSSIN